MPLVEYLRKKEFIFSGQKIRTMRLSVHCEWMILRVPREHPSSCLQSWLFRNIRQGHKERGRNQGWVSLDCLGEPGTEVPWALGLCSRGESSPGAWCRGWAWGWWSTCGQHPKHGDMACGCAQSGRHLQRLAGKNLEKLYPLFHPLPVTKGSG